MIKGKVAHLIDSRTLVLNIGSNDSVTKGMEFMIYDSKGRQIKDPDSGMTLGNLRISKLPVKVIKVEERFSVAETFRYDEINEGGVGTGFSNISSYLTPPKYVKKYETFEIDERDTKTIEIEKSKVKPGDFAEEIKKSDDKEQKSDKGIG